MHNFKWKRCQEKETHDTRRGDWIKKNSEKMLLSWEWKDSSKSNKIEMSEREEKNTFQAQRSNEGKKVGVLKSLVLACMTALRVLFNMPGHRVHRVVNTSRPQHQDTSLCWRAVRIKYWRILIEAWTQWWSKSTYLNGEF